MKLGLGLRRRVCRWLAATLLLVQWLTSAYACQEGTPEPVAEPPCHAGQQHATPAQPALCKAHCEADVKAPVQVPAPDAPLPGPGWFIVQDASAIDVLAAQPAMRPLQARAGSPPGWPPLHLTLQVLRN
ncbi:MAG: hypothetical protein JNM33_04990 [Rubrivivax sp.]|nr:hypothetical protein [Rubrivivax sp.]